MSRRFWRRVVLCSLFAVLASGSFLAASQVNRGGKAVRGAGAPYDRWKYGPPASPNYFPIAVWLQAPANAARYKAAGFNLYVGLDQGATEAQLTALRAAGMPVVCQQNAVGLAHKNDPIIVGWLRGDEPDNAQPITDPKTGQSGYGPCVPPKKVVADYERLRAADPTRPILLNLGQGVANEEWIGRGEGAKRDDYKTYVQGSDIVSFDVYPVAGLEKPDSENYLWYVPKGVSSLVGWTGGKKPIWNCVECTAIDGRKKATPQQVRSEVWMALIHGSRGLIYFVHQFKPQFDEHALLDDPPMLAAVTALNRQIQELAPVLNRPTIPDGASVRSASEQTPIALMVKRHGGATYLFTVGMRNQATQGTFSVRGLPANAKAEVLGESRTIPIQNGRFEDAFAPYEVHLYRIVTPPAK